MISSASRSGPLLFDTSAESWLARAKHSEVADWMREYLRHYQVNVSAVTVLERIRGYSLLWHRAAEDRRKGIESARIAYLNALGRVWPLNTAIAVVAGEIMALLPDPPTPPTGLIALQNPAKTVSPVGGSME